ncbi:hypothetical protein CLOM621_07967 [Clostridium sp. M62/1]|nr:hypothetical protein CLOM621_07967 [Clostridium sp. M62/1]
MFLHDNSPVLVSLPGLKAAEPERQTGDNFLRPLFSPGLPGRGGIMVKYT